MRRLIAVALITAIIASTATALIAMRLTSQSAAYPPDTTAVAPCDMFPNNVPEYTRTDVCVTPDGAFHLVH